MTDFALISFVSLIAILDPLAVVPVYLTLFTEEQRQRNAHLIALTASVAVLVTLTLFMLVGAKLLSFLGISLAAFRVSGGILIFLMALQMLEGSMSRVKRTESVEDYSDIQSYSIVPLAIPLLSGPGAMSTAILLSQKAPGYLGKLTLFGVIVACCALTYLTLRLAEKTNRLLGRTGIRIATRIMGLLLAAVAMQFVATGLAELFPGLTRMAPAAGIPAGS